MEQYLAPIGLILNSALITVNRHFIRIPDWLYLPGLLGGVGLIVAGAILTKTA